MAIVRFTPALRRFFPDLEERRTEATTVAELMKEIDHIFPGIAAYIVDDQGAVRKHVNIFIGEDMIEDRLKLSDRLEANDVVFIIQALSGG